MTSVADLRSDQERGEGELQQAAEPKEVKAASEQVQKAIAPLRPAVTAHASRSWR
jgi:hypothetical protein